MYLNSKPRRLEVSTLAFLSLLKSSSEIHSFKPKTQLLEAPA